MRIYVTNLNYRTTDEELNALFSKYGEVEVAAVETDKYSGRPKGRGFVDMPKEDEARAAIDALHGSRMNFLFIEVSEIEPYVAGSGRERA